MTIRVWVLAALTFLGRGLREGMIMHQPGPRDHVAFWAYHALDVAIIAGFCWLAVEMVRRWPGWLVLSGLLLAGWELTEVGYSMARWGVPVTGYEHVCFGDLISWTIDGWTVYALHAARAVAAAGIIIVGRLK
jgi:hypothetical protein